MNGKEGDGGLDNEGWDGVCRDHQESGLAEAQRK